MEKFGESARKFGDLACFSEISLDFPKKNLALWPLSAVVDCLPPPPTPNARGGELARSKRATHQGLSGGAI